MPRGSLVVVDGGAHFLLGKKELKINRHLIGALILLNSTRLLIPRHFILLILLRMSVNMFLLSRGRKRMIIVK